ncbi:MAG: universal stress protein [Gammaproteobacteria bacterium]|nr:universal stress protein [Gammaproteobacteria bacterium]
MSNYQHILAAVDLGEHSETVCSKARQLAESFGAKLTLIHVIEVAPMESMAEALVPTVDLPDDLVRSAKTRLAALSEKQQLEGCEQEVRYGNIKFEIVTFAREIAADLIILGSRERHGAAILVNYTEDTVLHAAPCDVLAIRVP